MPRRGFFHDTVCAALITDGWIITADPLTLPFGATEVYVDLGAEKPALAAEKNGRKIAVEIKGFRGASVVNDLEKALGQFFLYRTLLEQQDAERVLYIGIPSVVYEDFFRNPKVSDVIATLKIRLVIIDEEEMVVQKWIEP